MCCLKTRLCLRITEACLLKLCVLLLKFWSGETKMTAVYLSESLLLLSRKASWCNNLLRYSFFLEKNMLSFFLKIMRQKCGSYVCVQLLQTLNILFENIRNETSLCKDDLKKLCSQKSTFAFFQIIYWVTTTSTRSLCTNLTSPTKKWWPITFPSSKPCPSSWTLTPSTSFTMK